MTGWLESLADALGAAVRSVEPISGGCISDGHRVVAADGTRLFVKTGGVPAGGFAVEAAALEWLAEPGAIQLPAVVAVGEDFLALEWIEDAGAAPGADEALGRSLARLHQAGADGFGWDRDGYIGSIPQLNPRRDSWAEFWVTARLEPMMRRADAAAALPAGAGSVLERVADRMTDLVGPPEPPSRLHGDLWFGNRMHGPDGQPVLVDPAAYGGHREVDLAMMRLFGQFDPRCFAAYHEAAPLADGHEERLALWQAYPLLVHAVLFGGGYGARAVAALSRYT